MGQGTSNGAQEQLNRRALVLKALAGLGAVAVLPTALACLREHANKLTDENRAILREGLDNSRTWRVANPIETGARSFSTDLTSRETLEAISKAP
jgi:hypothetical protein